MKRVHLALVGETSEGRIEHPLDAVSLYVAWVRLSEILPADTWFFVEEVA